jgi:hypothetical protein NreA
MDKRIEHPHTLKRLRRAEGHLKSVLAMIETGRPCLDIAQQLQAVEKALANAKRELIHDHMEQCLSEGTQARLSLQELKELAKFLG